MAKKLTAWMLLAALLLSLSGCSGSSAPTLRGQDLMQDIRPREVSPSPASSQNGLVTDFGIRLFQSSLKPGENTLISPLSVVQALAMTANGADGQTRSQMEAVLGASTDVLNPTLHDMLESLSESEDGTLLSANAIWLRDTPTLSVEPDFLQTNADYFGADIYRAPFDEATRDDINRWVDSHTDHMIPRIVEELSDRTMLYLVDALSFDCQWRENYEAQQVQDGVFTAEDGTTQPVQLMYSSEWRYLEDDRATGFIKPYRDPNYAFAALLPKEGISVEDYVSSLTGAQLQALLSNPQDGAVEAGIPKFEVSFDLDLNQTLSTMGMPDAFDPSAADFSRLGSCQEGPIYIGKVLHKTFLSVSEQGTRAGAVTAVEFGAGAAAEPKTVILDRPFVYMLMDCRTNTPLFLGALMQPPAS